MAVLHFLYEQGFINSFTIKGVGPFEILVKLKYFRGTPTMHGIKVLSTPGKRNYLSLGGFRKLYKGAFSGTGIFAIETSKGFLTQHQCSLQNSGGEILFKVW
jgi:small subunit ribosomal protein S8